MEKLPEAFQTVSGDSESDTGQQPLWDQDSSPPFSIRQLRACVRGREGLGLVQQTHNRREEY